MRDFWIEFLRPFLMFWVAMLALLFAGVFAARAQIAQCGGYADVLADLATAYDEQIVWVGERAEAGQLVITARPDGSTWTALFVNGGVTCLIAAGRGWAARPAGEDT